MRNIPLFFCFLLFVNLLNAQNTPTVPTWQPAYQGVDLASWTLKKPRNIAAYLVRVDLQTPGLSLDTTPDNGPREGETDALKTSTFLTEGKYQLALNASPFDPIADVERAPQDVVGLQICQGKTISPGRHQFPALVITRNGHAHIERDSSKVKDAWTAVGGFSTILHNGQIVPHPNDPLHPRTAAGVTKNKRHIIFLIIDGRQPNYSEGATCEELGTWLRDAGCEDGINLDGGGSTTLLREPRAGQNTPIFLNRPIHSIFQRERIVGSHIGIRANQLPPENANSNPKYHRTPPPLCVQTPPIAPQKQ